VVIAEQNLLYEKEEIDGTFTHKFIKIDNDRMCKALLLNKACENIETEYIWFCDADVHLSFNEILPLIKNQNAIKPFKFIINLDEAETDIFISTGKLNIQKNSMVKSMPKLGPLTFIIKNECFKRIGGFNPDYVGHGFQDLDIASRILDYYNVDELDYYGLHLYHERPAENDKNFEIFDKLF
jgi:predicted glycosyltransferase involved in capsule biosynthesis